LTIVELRLLIFDVEETAERRAFPHLNNQQSTIGNHQSILYATPTMPSSGLRTHPEAVGSDGSSFRSRSQGCAALALGYRLVPRWGRGRFFCDLRVFVLFQLIPTSTWNKLLPDGGGMAFGMDFRGLRVATR